MTQDIHSGPGDLAPGDQLAGYQIQEQIGRGGMAVVYRALDLRLGRLVALKVLSPQLGEDHAFRLRFIRESRAAAGVDHPHIIPVFEAGEADGVLFIAMRYVSNGDLRSLIDARGRLSPARTCAIAAQVASALDAAHARGLVHRDIKPANVLLDQAAGRDADHVYLSDFGLSKHSLTPSTLTSTGQFLGTLDYVSPEQIQGQPVDGRADQYALACTVVEMLTAAPPFRRDDNMALMWAQLEAEPPRLTERRPELPAAVDQVVATAMAKSATGRFATCRDFAAALSAACGQNGGTRPGAVAESGGYPSAPVVSDPWGDLGQDDWRSSGWPASDRFTTMTAGPEAGLGAGPSWRDSPSAPAARPDPDLDDWFRQPGSSAAALAASQRPAIDHAWPASESAASRSQQQPPGHGGSSGRARSSGGRSPGGRSRRTRTFVLAGLLALVALAVVIGVAEKLAHRTPATTPPSGASRTGSASVTDHPARTVRLYFSAINHHRYAAAWRIGGQNAPIKSFEAGFAGTAHDTILILSTKGDIVTARLVARQLDGTVKTFEGTYTVTNNVISATDVHRIS